MKKDTIAVLCAIFFFIWGYVMLYFTDFVMTDSSYVYQPPKIIWHLTWDIYLCEPKR